MHHVETPLSSRTGLAVAFQRLVYFFYNRDEEGDKSRTLRFSEGSLSLNRVHGPFPKTPSCSVLAKPSRVLENKKNRALKNDRTPCVRGRKMFFTLCSVSAYYAIPPSHKSARLFISARMDTTAFRRENNLGRLSRCGKKLFCFLFYVLLSAYIMYIRARAWVDTHPSVGALLLGLWVGWTSRLGITTWIRAYPVLNMSIGVSMGRGYCVSIPIAP